MPIMMEISFMWATICPYLLASQNAIPKWHSKMEINVKWTNHKTKHEKRKIQCGLEKYEMRDSYIDNNKI